VLSASPDRRDASGDWRCGGNVLAHISYPRQRQLKAEIIQDAFVRIGRLPLEAPEVMASPERGYRMRARLHVDAGRLGFYREATHSLCDAAESGQLLPDTIAWMASVEDVILRERLSGLVALEIVENVAADQRACHLELQSGVDSERFVGIAQTDRVVGASAQRGDRSAIERLAGTPAVSDDLRFDAHGGTSTLRMRRDVRAFFQSNRFLLDHLAGHVAGLVTDGPVVDLYAGVGLFGLSLAAAGVSAVTLVEGDPVSGADLQANAAPFESRVTVCRGSVESFLHSAETPADATFIVDPPRTGLSGEAGAGVIAKKPARIVYVSCDVATLARDVRAFVNAGYHLERVSAFDLFPNTAHIETIIVLSM
jgi:23S rRNA (uracil1939-C5)-methyltransferase